MDIIEETTQFSQAQLLKYADKILPIFTKEVENLGNPVLTSRFSVDDDELEEFHVQLPDNDTLGVIRQKHGGSINKFFKTNEAILSIYRSMAVHPLIDNCITQILDEAMVFNNDPEVDPVKLIASRDKLIHKLKLRTEEAGKKIVKKLSLEFSDVLGLLNFKERGYKFFKQWFIDGQIHFETVYIENTPEITELRYISPFNLLKVKYREEYFYLYDPTKEKEVLQKFKTGKYTDNDFIGINQNLYAKENDISMVRLIPEKYIITIESGLKDPSGFPRSHIHAARKDLNQLVLLQDAVVVYRISRAQERRVIYVDVGKIQASRVKEVLKQIANNFRQKQIFDIHTGEVLDQRHVMGTTEDIYIPRYANGQTTEIKTLPGAENLGQLADVEYFQKNVIRAMKVPLSRFFDGDAVISLGKDQTLSRDEFTFNKYILRLQQDFAKLLLEIFKRQLINKKIIDSITDFEKIKQCLSIEFDGENYYAEVKKLEMLQFRMNIFQQAIGEIDENRFSLSWAYRNIMGFDKSEIDLIYKEREEELQDELAYMEKTLKYRLKMAEMTAELNRVQDINYQLEVERLKLVNTQQINNNKMDNSGE